MKKTLLPLFFGGFMLLFSVPRNQTEEGCAGSQCPATGKQDMCIEATK